MYHFASVSTSSGMALDIIAVSEKSFFLFDVVRLAPEEESCMLTGFVHNAVTCIGMNTDIPVM
jgi:hypothetical protein